MTLEITEKDKKLIIVASVIVIFVLLVFLAIMPLASKGRELSDEITTQQLIKQEKELKVTGYPALLARQNEVFEQYNALAGTYYPLMESQDIDRLMTGIALQNNAYIENLQITMPNTEEYAAPAPYTDIFVTDGTAVQQVAGFAGAYCAGAEMTVCAKREELRNMIDTCMALQPKQQVVSYSLQENSATNDRPYSLRITVNLYMCEDIETYIEKQKQMLEDAEAQNAGTENTDTQGTGTEDIEAQGAGA